MKETATVDVATEEPAGDEPATVDVATTALILGVNKSTVYEAIKRGVQPFPIIRLGDRILISRAALERLLNKEVPA